MNFGSRVTFGRAGATTQGGYSHFTEICSGSGAGSYLRRIDSCITHLKAQGPSSTCNESKEEEDDLREGLAADGALEGTLAGVDALVHLGGRFSMSEVPL